MATRSAPRPWSHGAPRSAVLVLVLGLVAALVPTVFAPSGAFAQQADEEFLRPGPGDFLFGTVETSVVFDQPNVEYVDFWIFWEDGGTQQFNYGQDDEPGVPGEHGYGNDDTVIPDVWDAVLTIPPNHPPGPAQLYAEAYVCELPADPLTCDTVPVAQTNVYVDGTPPATDLDDGLDDLVVTAGDVVTVDVTTPDPDLEGVDLFLQAFFHLDGKGLPKLDQHDEGADLSGDVVDGDGETGDMSCAPTAAASSLLWFGENGYPGLTPTGPFPEDSSAGEELTETIGEGAETGDGGTAPDKLVKSIRDYIKSKNLDDDLEVSDWGDEVDTTVKAMETEFGRGQDVLLGLYWTDGGAHRVALENIEKNEDGTVELTIMDPWTGEYETVTIAEDGTATHSNGDELEIKKMIHVSPTDEEGEPVGEATPDESGGEGAFSFEWDTTDVEAGRYLLRSAPGNGIDVSSPVLFDYAAITVVDEEPDEACPGGAPSAGFTDVPEGNVHAANIDCAAFWEITSGTGEDTYSPSGTVTRAQMATFIVATMQAAGYEFPADPPDAFTDDDGTTHEANINRLAAAGVVQGTGDGYDPDGQVSRGQMATFLATAYEVTTGSELPAGADAFTDDDGTTHEANINRVAAAGIAQGTGEGTYAPAQPVRRDAMATFLTNLLDTFVAAGFASPPSG